MTNTPPRLQKRGSMSAVVTVAITGLVFTSIPLAQWIGDVFKPVAKEQQVEPIRDSAPPDPVVVEPPKAEEPEEIQDIKPPSIDDLAIILNPMSITWGGYSCGTGLKPDIPMNMDDIVDISVMDSPPRPVVRVSPKNVAYSTTATGRVDIEVVVDEKGEVLDAKVVRRLDSVLERNALAAARKWRFEPGTVKGKPTKFRVVIPFVFSR